RERHSTQVEALREQNQSLIQNIKTLVQEGADRATKVTRASRMTTRSGQLGCSGETPQMGISKKGKLMKGKSSTIFHVRYPMGEEMEDPQPALRRGRTRFGSTTTVRLTNKHDAEVDPSSEVADTSGSRESTGMKKTGASTFAERKSRPSALLMLTAGSSARLSSFRLSSRFAPDEENEEKPA
ncbi:unnamed protein product, partial [Amoebophrya sp. A25]